MLKFSLRRLLTITAIFAMPIIGLAVEPVYERWLTASFGPEVTATGDSEASVALAAYLASRNPVIDRLLPEGRGGTMFRADLGSDKGGMLLKGTSAVVIAANSLHRGEEIELHERAHAFHFAHADIVQDLIDVLPAAESDTYAATSTAEHFAEMAATAWTIVEPPEFGICPADPSADILQAAEDLVPGTAGFLLWFAEAGDFADDPVVGQYVAAATLIVDRYRDQWQPIDAALRAYRDGEGNLRRIEVGSIRQRLVGRYRVVSGQSNPLWRLAALASLPAIAVVSLVD